MPKKHRLPIRVPPQYLIHHVLVVRECIALRAKSVASGNDLYVW